MPDSFNHDVHMTGFYTNISSSFMPCTINKKGPYFVTVHRGSPGTLTFSEKNYLPADT